MAGAPLATRFHGYLDSRVRPYQIYQTGSWTARPDIRHTTTVDRHLSYSFSLHAHPYVPELVKKLIAGSVPGLQGADTEYVQNADGSFQPLKDSSGKTKTLSDGTPIPQPRLYEELFSKTSYGPSNLVGEPYPVKDLDFTASGAYSVYNWELFFHIPLAVAVQLSQNQRYEDAERWFRYLFDPTDDSDGSTPERFWKVKPFQFTDVRLIQEILVNLSSGVDPTLQQDTTNSISAWKHNPFRPFAVARYRQSAFMFKTMMAYFDHHIGWGDFHYSQYTGESINEALQHYILVANLQGHRPQAVPKKGSVRPHTYANLRTDLDPFGNTLVDFETEIPFDNAPFPGPPSKHAGLATLSSIGRALYFCVPRNDKLLKYWDIVADRLFKIHNSLNIQGIFQQVPLFEPPIDPAMLVRAAAAGLDVGAIVSGLNQPMPLVRFQYLVQKAAEICQEVKSLGGNLLAAMEKQDNEALSILRARHETEVLQLAESVKYAAYQEAIKNRQGLEQSLVNAAARYTYFQNLLGNTPQALPTLDPLDEDALKKTKLKADEPTIALQPISIDIAQDLSATGGIPISSHEADELGKLATAHDTQEAVHIARMTAHAFGMIPDPALNLHYWGIGGKVELPGGEKMAAVATFAADIALTIADQLSYEAGKAGKISGYANRQRDYQYQVNLAAGEITQTFKQLRAAQIREAMARLDWSNHKTQIAHAAQIEKFLTDPQFTARDIKGKTTNQGFYLWMKRELKALYGQAFQFAFEVARKAERALQLELGDSSLSYIQFGYLAGKEGLLAGEKLYQDIKRMELAYADLNRREYELTKHVSLLQVDPAALLRLRASGSCTVTLPEELFDFDGPGHYFRRIKSVALSIPCVSGPYTSVNCTLTLLKSSIRVSALPGSADGNPYMRDGADDPRFSDFFGSAQSVVTSTGQADSGLFETNLHDERKLPFEYSGAVSQWQLELPGAQLTPPAAMRQFDYDTIADAILHVRYTAREGGLPLRKLATDNLAARIAAAEAPGSVRLFSMRHEFPTEWSKFTATKQAGASSPAALVITFRPEHYPLWAPPWLASVLHVNLYARYPGKPKPVQVFYALDANKAAMGSPDSLPSLEPAWPGWAGGDLPQFLARTPAPTSTWSFYLDDTAMSDLFLAVTWGKPAQ
jgi:cell division protein FtsB